MKLGKWAFGKPPRPRLCDICNEGEGCNYELELNDTNRQACAHNQVSAGADRNSFDPSVHALTQIARANGADPGSYACACKECDPPIKRIASSSQVFSGWRSFTLTLDYQWLPILRGSNGVEWEDRRLTAICQVQPMFQTTSGLAIGPDIKQRCRNHLEQGVCSCGIYIVKEDIRPRPQEEGFASYVLSIGRIAVGTFAVANCPHMMSAWACCVGYGTVFEHSDGYRVSECRIDQLWVPDDAPQHITEQVAERYQIPVQNWKPAHAT